MCGRTPFSFFRLVVYIAMFIYKGLYLTAFNYAVYFVLAVMGFYAWRKSLR